MIPRLHLVTNDAVLRRHDFTAIATELLLVLQRRAALHIRARELAAATIFRIVSELRMRADTVGTLLVVNDRVDIALAAKASGIQLGIDSLPIATARALVGPGKLIGYSAHGAEEAATAQREGADFIFAGSIYPTASHPGVVPGGSGLLEKCVAACAIPVLAIGGVQPERVPEVQRTGAYGIAVIGAVWDAPDPVQAGEQLAKLLDE